MKLWQDWVDGSWGRRQLTWSQGLRELAGMANKAADEELGSDGDTVVRISTLGWKRISEDSAKLLDIAETRGTTELCRQLDLWKVSYHRVELDYTDEQ